MELALEAGADDLEERRGLRDLQPSDAFHAVQQALEKAEIAVAEAGLVREPQNTVELDGKKAEQCLKLLEILEDHDDAQNVYANLEIEDGRLESSDGGGRNRGRPVACPAILGVDPGSRVTGWALLGGTPARPRASTAA